MNWLKQNWWLIVFIFSLGVGYAKLQIEISDIHNKLDRQEFYSIRKEDSLKSVIEKLKVANLQRKLMPVSDSLNGGGN